jgi:hypothetical protein
MRNGIMNKLITSVLVATLTFTGANVFASDETVTSQSEEVRMRSLIYSSDYDSMMALVQKQKFAEAFPEIIRFARYGEKYAQYLAGLLMVTGQDGVPVNIEEGLVWMRLSLEQETSDWEKRYAEITKNLTKDQLDSLNPMYNEYKAKFGAEAQNMRCGFERLRGSNMRRHVCRKNLLMNEYYTVTQYN